MVTHPPGNKSYFEELLTQCSLKDPGMESWPCLVCSFSPSVPFPRWPPMLFFQGLSIAQMLWNVRIRISSSLCLLFRIRRKRPGLGDHLAVESFKCSCRGPRFRFQHPQGDPQVSLTLVLGDPVLYQTHM